MKTLASIISILLLAQCHHKPLEPLPEPPRYEPTHHTKFIPWDQLTESEAFWQQVDMTNDYWDNEYNRDRNQEMKNDYEEALQEWKERNE